MAKETTLNRVVKLYPDVLTRIGKDALQELISHVEWTIDQYDMDEDVYEYLEELEIKTDAKGRFFFSASEGDYYFWVPEHEPDSMTESRWINFEMLDEDEYPIPE